NLRFVEADFENLSFGGMFDAVLFIDSLHQAVDEQEAIANAYRALKVGGICLASEPGRGHAGQTASIVVGRNCRIAKKDLPIRKVCSLSRRAGFRDFRIYPDAATWVSQLYGSGKRTKAYTLFSALLAWLSYRRLDNGICVMVK